MLEPFIKILESVSNLTVIETEVNKEDDYYASKSKDGNKRHFDISEGTFDNDISSHH